jgi:ribosomal protein S18 acetylase RimI-like enzyme
MKSAGKEIRPLGLEDLREVFVLGQELFQGKDFCPFRAWSEKVLAEILADNLEISFVAVRKKRTAGFLIGAIAERGESGTQAEILWLGVRGGEDRSVGRDLIEAFAAACAERGCADVRIEVQRSGTELIDLLQERSFTQSGQVLILERVLTKNK